MNHHDAFQPLALATKLKAMSDEELQKTSLAAMFERDWSNLEDRYVALGDLLSETAPISREGRAALRRAIGEMFSRLYTFDHDLTVVEVILDQRS